MVWPEKISSAERHLAELVYEMTKGEKEFEEGAKKVSDWLESYKTDVYNCGAAAGTPIELPGKP